MSAKGAIGIGPMFEKGAIDALVKFRKISDDRATVDFESTWLDLEILLRFEGLQKY